MASRSALRRGLAVLAETYAGRVGGAGAASQSGVANAHRCVTARGDDERPPCARSRARERSRASFPRFPRERSATIRAFSAADPPRDPAIARADPGMSLFRPSANRIVAPGLETAALASLPIAPDLLPHPGVHRDSRLLSLLLFRPSSRLPPRRAPPPRVRRAPPRGFAAMRISRPTRSSPSSHNHDPRRHARGRRRRASSSPPVTSSPRSRPTRRRWRWSPWREDGVAQVPCRAPRTSPWASPSPCCARSKPTSPRSRTTHPPRPPPPPPRRPPRTPPQRARCWSDRITAPSASEAFR